MCLQQAKRHLLLEHHWLLTEIASGVGLRRSGGLRLGCVHDRVAALRGGLDLEMPPNLGVSDAASSLPYATGHWTSRFSMNQ